jgi:CTP:molybdopterin cytidylyltransferase MocA
MECKGDEGALEILKENQACVLSIAIADSGIRRDTNHPEDITRWLWF